MAIGSEQYTFGPRYRLTSFPVGGGLLAPRTDQSAALRERLAGLRRHLDALRPLT
jgi:hypothetical protein